MSLIVTTLLRKNLVTEEQVSFVKTKRESLSMPVQDILIDIGHLKEDDYFSVAREMFKGRAVDLDDIVIDTALIKLIPLKQVKHYGIFPITKENGGLLLGMSDPSDILVIEELQFITGLDVTPVLCRRSQMVQYVAKYYEPKDSVQEILKDAMEGQDMLVKPLKVEEEVVDFARIQSDDAAIVKLVNKLIHDAIGARASDIHIEPQSKSVRIRYRIDGYLKDILEIPSDLQKRLLARIKILADLNIAEQRSVQEGRIKALIEGKKIDLRISLIPTFYGEKIVIRILDTNTVQYNLDLLGFQPDELSSFREMITKRQGVILVTGPTGSGKTTTLYAALQHVKSEDKNIVTIEDPIEYLIEGVNQLQLNHFKDVTFASGLRSILRQDPNIILVGEIRDRETAEIAFRASLTGHLVFSTLHTNNAVASITRLYDIGLEPYLISSSLIALVAQRLVRLNCSYCAQEEKPDPQLLAKFQRYLSTFGIERFYHGRGCEYCHDTGFFGRTSVYEILKIDDKMKNLIYNKSSERVIFKEAVAGGMRTLVESGLMKVASGLTSLAEISRALDLNDEPQENIELSLDPRWTSVPKP